MGAGAAARRFEIRQGDAAQRADLVRQALHALSPATIELMEGEIESGSRSAEGSGGIVIAGTPAGARTAS
jgi:hypothetical protein